MGPVIGGVGPLIGGMGSVISSLHGDVRWSFGKITAQKTFLTERIAFYHSLSAHYQIVQWISLLAEAIDPLKWGWLLHSDKLRPVYTGRTSP